MGFELLVLTILPALFILAAVWDLTSFTIPNFLILSLFSLFIVFICAAAISGSSMTWYEAGFHLLSGAIGLAAGMALFAMGMIGGGDAKLFAVAALWLGLNTLFEYTIVASLLGGGLTLGMIFLRRMPVPGFLIKYEWIARLHDKEAGIPYGVALAAAALMILPHTELFRSVIGG
jgi:prepilin peptidase CpaA